MIEEVEESKMLTLGEFIKISKVNLVTDKTPCSSIGCNECPISNKCSDLHLSDSSFDAYVKSIVQTYDNIQTWKNLK